MCWSPLSLQFSDGDKFGIISVIGVCGASFLRYSSTNSSGLIHEKNEAIVLLLGVLSTVLFNQYHGMTHEQPGFFVSSSSHTEMIVGLCLLAPTLFVRTLLGRTSATFQTPMGAAPKVLLQSVVAIYGVILQRQTLSLTLFDVWNWIVWAFPSNGAAELYHNSHHYVFWLVPYLLSASPCYSAWPARLLRP